MNVALFALGATVTALGTVMLPVLVSGTVPPELRALLRVSVQAEDAPGARISGLQASPLNVGSTALSAVPPKVVVGIANASSDAPSPPATPMGAEATPGANETITLATTPSAMTLPLRPLATQRYPPAPVSAQARPFPAAVSEGPAVTVTLLTSEGE